MHHECTQLRRILTRHSLLSLATGQTQPDPDRPDAWATRPCAAPLFADDERASGICRSCANGWKHPNNYPAGERAPLFEINPARPDHGTRDPDTGRPIVRPRHLIDAGAGYWLEGRTLMAAPLVAHPLIPNLLRPDWASDYEVDPAFPGYAAIVAELSGNAARTDDGERCPSCDVESPPGALRCIRCAGYFGEDSTERAERLRQEAKFTPRSA